MVYVLPTAAHGFAWYVHTWVPVDIDAPCKSWNAHRVSLPVCFIQLFFAVDSTLMHGSYVHTNMYGPLYRVHSQQRVPCLVRVFVAGLSSRVRVAQG